MDDPEIRKQFEELEARMRQAEKQILTTGNLVSKAGIPALVNTQMRLDGLEESHARLYGTVQHIADQLIQVTESVDRLAKTVQAFIDSMSRSGNGSKS